MNSDNVPSICNDAVETDNNCNVEPHTVENVEDQTLGTNDDVNSVKSKSGHPHKVKFNALDVTNNNASKAEGDVLSQSHIDGSHESISSDCFVPLCNSETCAYENNSSPPKMSKSHPTTNDNCTPKEQKKAHEEEENVSDLVLNTSFHKHGECKSPCGICAYVKWKEITEGRVKVKEKKVCTKRYGTSNITVSTPKSKGTYILDDSERNLVSEVISTAVSKVSSKRNQNKKMCDENQKEVEINLKKDDEVITSNKGKGESAWHLASKFEEMFQDEIDHYNPLYDESESSESEDEVSKAKKKN